MFDTGQDSYRTLRAIVAERTRPVIVWVGAGLSMEAGVPSWAGLRKALEDALYRRAMQAPPDSLTKAMAEADSIRSESNYWVAFERLQRSLGATSYRDLVREAFEPASTAVVPKAYEQLWQLPINGILTLNLDRMASRGYGVARPGHVPVEFIGHQVGRLAPSLHTERKFVANLHGVVDDSSSWVFTHSELKTLRSNAAYKKFLTICLATFTNIFVGMTVEDIAVGSHLQSLRDVADMESPSHFWITHRAEPHTREWAESVGVRTIQYRIVDERHTEVNEILGDLINAAPVEPPAPPPVVFSNAAKLGEDSLLPPEDMLSLSAEEMRQRLNKEAVRILGENDDDTYVKYEKFVQEYDEIIFRAWYTSDRPGRNRLLGYTLEEQVATGAFGRVYRAINQAGEQVAVKILLDEVRRDPSLLRSFRRGVRSMQILQDSNIEGMVAYADACEIPAFVAMEWIEGPNLLQAKQGNLLQDWSDVLHIGLRVTEIIKEAHALPQRVLHRDIRPSNVMLRDFWVTPEEYEVVVLDFDLSWHRGAQEASVLHTTAVGYLAPEQIVEGHDGSTRNAAVDAFGIGMTLYYICGGFEPLPELHRHADYVSLVRRAVNSISESGWRSLSERISRLIVAATKDRQSERWDLSQIYTELTNLRAVHLGETIKATTPMVAEEMAARMSIFSGYEWIPDENSAMRVLPTGLTLKMIADEPSGAISIHVSWMSTGIEQRVGMAKYVKQATRQLVDKLKSSAWQVVEENSEGQSMTVRATRRCADIKSNIEVESNQLDGLLSGLRFSD